MAYANVGMESGDKVALQLFIQDLKAKMDVSSWDVLRRGGHVFSAVAFLIYVAATTTLHYLIGGNYGKSLLYLEVSLAGGVLLQACLYFFSLRRLGPALLRNALYETAALGPIEPWQDRWVYPRNDAGMADLWQAERERLIAEKSRIRKEQWTLVGDLDLPKWVVTHAGLRQRVEELLETPRVARLVEDILLFRAESERFRASLGSNGTERLQQSKMREEMRRTTWIQLGFKE